MKNQWLLLLALVVFSTGIQAKYKAVEVTDGGVVAGAVRFAGEVPTLQAEQIALDNEVCGEGDIIPNPISVSADGGLENVVVFLDKVKEGKAWPEQEYKLDQLKCTFKPYLQVVPKGVKMTISNSDPVLHNVHPYELVGDKRRTLFNLAQPKLGQVNTKAIKTRRGNAVELSCDAHSWMAGWLYVLEHPYFAVVGADGLFSIDGVPAGTYTLKAWHPELGEIEQEIEVVPGESVESNFEYSS